MTALQRFLDALKPRDTVVRQYTLEDNPEVEWYVWLINVPRSELCAVEDHAVELALEIYPDRPLPFIIGVATPEKTAALFAEPTNQASRGSTSFSGPIGQPAGAVLASEFSVTFGLTDSGETTGLASAPFRLAGSTALPGYLIAPQRSSSTSSGSSTFHRLSAA